MERKYKVICVDDESIILNGIKLIIEANPLVSEVKGFTKAFDAIEWVSHNFVDIAFLDIEMYQMSGIELAKQLRKINPNLYIIFLTGYTEYAMQAFGVHANGFLKKPVDKDDIDRELHHFENLTSLKVPEKKIIIHTFGNFELYIDGEKMKFSYHLTKELIAYLVDRKGASVTMSELTTICDEYAKNENSAKSMIRTAVAELRKIAEHYHIDNFFEKSRNAIRINTTLVNCDYYNYLKGDINAINAYMGEYMSNYSWAELTNAWLQNNRKFVK